MEYNEKDNILMLQNDIVNFSNSFKKERMLSLFS